jgi:phosphonate transport system ATP-binding protein
MIELLGVGVPGAGGQWLLHRVCARIDHGVLTAVLARTPAQSAAFLDAVAGNLVPVEGRVWVSRRPLMRETAARIRALAADAGRVSAYSSRRSVLWNTLVTGGHALAGLLRFPRRAGRRAALQALERVGLADRARHPMAALTPGERLRVALARARCSNAAIVVLRDVDTVAAPEEIPALLRLAREAARTERSAVIVSLASPALARAHADRVIALADGLVVFDGPARELTDDQARRPLGALVP